ncbi:gluconokinase [Hymenobacter baengnokdamensis]|uniref:gluconokinase n=1 Tax=Hymenobacter baengnokdamensis TaxID=2615203 RepID=UPI0012441259|nr:gluconokinase [Hymenobacter baengnokdamensis]
MKQPNIIVMGVSGCGKTTVGQLLAQRIGRPFYDGDDFHPAANVAKMAQGIPLTDEDRAGWLATLAAHLGQWEQASGAVLACSALRESYRQTLQAGAQLPLQWVFLDGDPAVLRARLTDRQGHYMKAAMLDSQLATLERPAYGLRLSIEDTPEQLVAQAITQLQLPEKPLPATTPVPPLTKTSGSLPG